MLVVLRERTYICVRSEQMDDDDVQILQYDYHDYMTCLKIDYLKYAYAWQLRTVQKGHWLDDLESHVTE